MWTNHFDRSEYFQKLSLMLQLLALVQKQHYSQYKLILFLKLQYLVTIQYFLAICNYNLVLLHMGITFRGHYSGIKQYRQHKSYSKVTSASKLYSFFSKFIRLSRKYNLGPRSPLEGAPEFKINYNFSRFVTID